MAPPPPPVRTALLLGAASAFAMTVGIVFTTRKSYFQAVRNPPTEEDLELLERWRRGEVQPPPPPPAPEQAQAGAPPPAVPNMFGDNTAAAPPAPASPPASGAGAGKPSIRDMVQGRAGAPPAGAPPQEAPAQPPQMPPRPPPAPGGGPEWTDPNRTMVGWEVAAARAPVTFPRGPLNPIRIGEMAGPVLTPPSEPPAELVPPGSQASAPPQAAAKPSIRDMVQGGPQAPPQGAPPQQPSATPSIRDMVQRGPQA